MAHSYTVQNSNNWQTHSFNGKNNDSDPFFDPQSLTITQSEFKPVPLPDDDFEPFLEKFNDIDNMLSETLAFQDLNIPNGYHQQQDYYQNGYPVSSKKHSRKESGSAIFGFANNHTHQLSIPGVNITEQSFKKASEQIDYYNSNFESMAPTSQAGSAFFAKKETQAQHISPKRYNDPEGQQDDFIITGKTPVAFKFPPEARSGKKLSPSHSLHRAEHNPQMVSNDSSYLNQNATSFLPPQYYQLQNTSSSGYSVDYINKLQDISKNQGNRNVHERENKYADDLDPFLDSILKAENAEQTPANGRDNKSKFYLLPREQNLEKPILTLAESSLNYSSPEEYYSSPNNSPILPAHMFASPQHNPPQMPELQTPQKMKLPPVPKLQPASLMTPTKYITNNQENIAERYNYRAEGQLETPKKQTTGENDKVLWTPVLVREDDPVSFEIVKEQAKRKSSSPIRKETKITSTFPKGHLDQYFVGPDDDQKFTCTFNDCGKQFSRISNTRAHIQTHLSDRPFPCPYCQKKFVRNHDLKRHEKSHAEFTFTCPCGKKFPRQDALKRHRARNICAGGVEDDKPVSPDKKLVSKPLKKKNKPTREDELHDGLKDRILEELNYGTKSLEFDYLDTTGTSGELLLGNLEAREDQKGYIPTASNEVAELDYERFDL